jgi:hypothetical protein
VNKKQPVATYTCTKQEKQYDHNLPDEIFSRVDNCRSLWDWISCCLLIYFVHINQTFSLSFG